MSSLVGLINGLGQIAGLQEELEGSFEQHPSAEVLRSLPGLGIVLGAQVLGEFGDDPTRYADASARCNYAGTSPITKASGTRRVVLARFARNERLFDACYLWAFSSLTKSPEARRYYDAQRARGQDPQPGAPRAWQSPGRGPSRMPEAPRALPGGVAWPAAESRAA